jgi:hypothetical protein
MRTGERFGLLTRTATTESVTLCTDEKLTAFLELERAICIHLLTKQVTGAVSG